MQREIGFLSARRPAGGGRGGDCKVENQHESGCETWFIHLAVKNKWFGSVGLYTAALLLGNPVLGNKLPFL